MSEQRELSELLRNIDTRMYQGDIFFSSNANITLRLRRMFLNPKYSLAEIAELMVADPIMGSRVLALANSAMYGCRRSSVREAGHSVGS